ncbi:biotin transporter BioY [Paenibacillus sp. CF384]|uniref:biotin transporter BioY n=1 Tax=Paenibacillus sp. CF384 TaxID=1884382 RepID=UPI000898B9C1|nr:biotin transporter BioY [Paenibacillus sp. CF384]SDX51443.1 biotin transport system substrate-specific component [Paenibacillus sp. CF384]
METTSSSNSNANNSSSAVLAPISDSGQSGATYWIRGIVFTALFAALFIAFGYVSIPLGFTTVPITLQTFAIMLAGGLLGARFGFWSIAIVIILTACGLPLLHGNGGIGVIFGATGGYIWMFPISALLIGLASDRIFARTKKLNRSQYVMLFISLVLFSVVLAYVGGVPWLAYKANYSFAKAMVNGCYPFLFGDMVKAIAATFLIAVLRPLLPKLR